MAIAPEVRSARRVPWTWITVGTAAAALLLILTFGLRRDPTAIPSPLVGRMAPEFALPLFDGSTLRSANLRGHVVVVNFWASWCIPACHDEAPHLQRISQRYQSAGVVVVGVNVQDQDAPARAFIRRFGQTFPNGVDRTGRISVDYGVYGVPETFVIDRTGRVVSKRAGPVTEEWLAAEITPLLGVSVAP